MKNTKKILIINPIKKQSLVDLEDAYRNTIDAADWDFLESLFWRSFDPKKSNPNGYDFKSFLNEENLTIETTFEHINNLLIADAINAHLNGSKLTIQIKGSDLIDDQKPQQNINQETYKTSITTKSLNLQIKVKKFISEIKSNCEDEFEINEQAEELIRSNIQSIPNNSFEEIIHTSISLNNQFLEVCPLELKHLIERYHQKNTSGLIKHKEFWKYISDNSDTECEIAFDKLFDNISPLEAFKYLSKQNEVPYQFISWIRVCKQENNIDYKVINGLMSFVISLVGRLPIKYLIKTAFTLSNSYSGDAIGLIHLVKKVIISDFQNGKNRLRVPKPRHIQQTKKIKKIARSSKDFSCYV